MVGTSNYAQSPDIMIVHTVCSLVFCSFSDFIDMMNGSVCLLKLDINPKV